jgi:hypothetical protein
MPPNMILNPATGRLDRSDFYLVDRAETSGIGGRRANSPGLWRHGRAHSRRISALVSPGPLGTTPGTPDARNSQAVDSQPTASVGWQPSTVSTWLELSHR